MMGIQTAVSQPQPSPTQPLVLIIDDQPSVREAIADILELRKISSLVAASGFEGLDVYREHQATIRLIILDFVMPNMTGEETSRKLRQISADVPILFTSGYDELSFQGELPSGENIDFLQKPFQFKQLIEKVEALLNRSAD